ncbi:MAG: sialidase family protein [Ilumatobacteraceae bacterium]
MTELPPLVCRLDPRDLKAARVVSDRNGYYDSQNIVAVRNTATGAEELSVVLHHSENREGGPGLRLLSTRSTDRGRTWTQLAQIDEPTRQSHDGYQLVHRRDDGSERIVVFYGWNVGSHYPPGADPSLTPILRTDMQLDEGYWCRVSDDGGRSWGAQRYCVPVRRTAIDRDNPWGGATMGMFLCDKPSVIDGAVYMAFQKTRDGAGETPGSEVFFLRSRNLLHVDLADATWETLPDGDRGLQAPDGELALGEEPHIMAVSDALPGRLFSLWRAETGKLAAAYTDDGGHTWGAPFWLTYEGLPLGTGGVQLVKNPRGSITPYRMRRPSPTGGAEFVMLFYNNGHTERLGYTGRRVYWLTVGRGDDNGTIRWSQPEIGLYWDGTGFEGRPGWNPDWAIVDGPGYPDWMELADDTLACVESNKLAVRYHEMDRRLLQYLRVQPELSLLPVEGRVIDWHADEPTPPGMVLPDLRSGAGFTLSVQFRGTRMAVLRQRMLVAAYTNATAALGEEPTDERITKGYEIAVNDAGEIELFVTDGFGATMRHATGTAASAALWDGRDHVVSFIVDGGPKVVSVVVDERLDDGGEGPQGWAFVPTDLGEVGGAELLVAPDFGGVLSRFVLFDRALLTSEAIAATRALLAP